MYKGTFSGGRLIQSAHITPVVDLHIFTSSSLSEAICSIEVSELKFCIHVSFPVHTMHVSEARGLLFFPPHKKRNIYESKQCARVVSEVNNSPNFTSCIIVLFHCVGCPLDIECTNAENGKRMGGWLCCRAVDRTVWESSRGRLLGCTVR